MNRAAAGIGRALGKALNRIQKVDSDVRKVMDARARNLQALGRDAGRKMATLGKAGSRTAKRAVKKTRPKKAAARRAGSKRRVAVRR
jgi:Skp family chaperone for outer membrane proteins